MILRHANELRIYCCRVSSSIGIDGRELRRGGKLENNWMELWCLNFISTRLFYSDLRILKTR